MYYIMSVPKKNNITQLKKSNITKIKRNNITQTNTTIIKEPDVITTAEEIIIDESIIGSIIRNTKAVFASTTFRVGLPIFSVSVKLAKNHFDAVQNRRIGQINEFNQHIISTTEEVMAEIDSQLVQRTNIIQDFIESVVTTEQGRQIDQVIADQLVPLQQFMDDLSIETLSDFRNPASISRPVQSTILGGIIGILSSYKAFTAIGALSYIFPHAAQISGFLINIIPYVQDDLIEDLYDSGVNLLGAVKYSLSSINEYTTRPDDIEDILEALNKIKAQTIKPIIKKDAQKLKKNKIVEAFNEAIKIPKKDTTRVNISKLRKSIKNPLVSKQLQKTDIFLNVPKIDLLFLLVSDKEKQKNKKKFFKILKKVRKKLNIKLP